MTFSNLKSSSNQSVRIIKLLPLNAYKSILVIIDKAEQIRHNQFHQKFPCADFTFLTIRSEKQDDSSGKNYTFHKNDKRFGKIKNDRLLSLMALNFDLIIDLSEKKDLKYFCENISANLKAGCFNTDLNFNLDLLVNNTGTTENVIDNLAKQIQKLTLNNTK